MSNLKSRAVAVMFALATAAPLTLATSIATPTVAEAGVISSIKGAANAVKAIKQTF